MKHHHKSPCAVCGIEVARHADGSPLRPHLRNPVHRLAHIAQLAQHEGDKAALLASIRKLATGEGT